MAKDPTAIAAKWATNLGNSTQTITAGINSVTESPTAKAARNVDGYLAGVQNSVASGKYQRGLANVSLEQWRQAAITKGIPRIAAGAVSAKPKVAAFLQNFLPFLDNVTAQVRSMPNQTLQQRIQRAVAQMTGVSQYKGSGGI